MEGKVVVLTGSFLPEKFKDSDADFNLGVAVGKSYSWSVRSACASATLWKFD
jgi:L-asparaginase/Glu-tRNA(Gln) amidotransferase subunit D